MPLAHVRLYLDGTGPRVVQVNGEDVADRIAEVGIKSRPGAPAELWLMTHAELEIEGEGIVKVALVREDESDPREAIVAFLNDIDPAELERVTLEDMGFGDGNITEAMLEKLKEMARGD